MLVAVNSLQSEDAVGTVELLRQTPFAGIGPIPACGLGAATFALVRK